MFITTTDEPKPSVDIFNALKTDSTQCLRSKLDDKVYCESDNTKIS